MGLINYGTQNTVFGYYQEATAKGFSNLDYQVKKSGIYYGFAISRNSDTSISIATGKCIIEDSVQRTSSTIETSTSATITCSNLNNYVVFRFAWFDTTTNYMDMLAIPIGSILPTDVIVGKLTYSGTVLNGVDYSYRSFGNLIEKIYLSNTTNVLNINSETNFWYMGNDNYTISYNRLLNKLLNVSILSTSGTYYLLFDGSNYSTALISTKTILYSSSKNGVYTTIGERVLAKVQSNGTTINSIYTYENINAYNNDLLNQNTISNAEYLLNNVEQIYLDYSGNYVYWSTALNISPVNSSISNTQSISITCPTSNNILNNTGSTITATASGIPLQIGQSLYYDLTNQFGDYRDFYITDKNFSIAITKNYILIANRLSTYNVDITNYPQRDLLKIDNAQLNLQGFGFNWDYQTTENFVLNGNFTTGSTSWILGANWLWDSVNRYIKTSGTSAGTASQTAVTYIQGVTYAISYTLGVLAVGSMTVSINGAAGTARTSAGTYTEEIVAGASGGLIFTPTSNASSGTWIDSITVYQKKLQWSTPIVGTSVDNLFSKTLTITDPTQALIDEETKLLLHFENNVTDSAQGLTVTNNNVTFGTTTPSPKFGTYDGVFNGTNSYLSVGPDPSIDITQGDFTIDWWEYRTSATSTKSSLFISDTSSLFGLLLGYSDGTNYNLLITSNNTSWDVGSAVIYGTLATYASTWVHQALVRKGNIFYMFLAGTLKATVYVDLPVTSQAATLWIGRYNTSYFTGNIDELRITKKALWTSSFTPPTLAYVMQTTTTVPISLNNGSTRTATANGINLQPDEALYYRPLNTIITGDYERFLIVNTADTAINIQPNWVFLYKNYQSNLKSSLYINSNRYAGTTVSVASKYSSPVNKANANYICTGVSDDVVIQNAISYVSSLGGGSVLLMEGTYFITTNIVIASNVNLQGVGDSTLLVRMSTTLTQVILVNSNIINYTLSNFKIDGNGLVFVPTNSYGIACVDSTTNTNGKYLNIVSTNNVAASVSMDFKNCAYNLMTNCSGRGAAGYQYLVGSTYNGVAINLVFSLNDTGSVYRGILIPYQTIDGAWHIKIDLGLNFTSSGGVSGYQITIAGIVYKNVVGFAQPVIHSFTVSGGNAFGYAAPGSNIFGLWSAAALTGSAGVYADVELDARPTFA